MANNIKQVSNVNGSTMNLGDIEKAAIRGVEQGTNHFSGGYRQNVTALGDGIDDRQLTEADCGYITIGVVGTETAASKGYNIDLPTPASGLWYKIVFVGPSIANNSNAAITVTSNSDDSSTAANLIVGQIAGQGDDDGANVVAVADLITFVHAKATAGDYVELFSDGTNWIVDAQYDADGAITLA
tara:strand:+ start:569 stop:1123 length:555 start_codon:yes stop_codon:yes gene_type:complete